MPGIQSSYPPVIVDSKKYPFAGKETFVPVPCVLFPTKEYLINSGTGGTGISVESISSDSPFRLNREKDDTSPPSIMRSPILRRIHTKLFRRHM